MKKSLLLFSVLTSLLLHAQFSYSCQPEYRELVRHYIEQDWLGDASQTCIKCYKRKMDHAITAYGHVTRWSQEKHAAEKAAVYNCPTCDKIAVDPVANPASKKSESEKQASEAAINAKSQECIVPNNPSMASICTCAVHKLQYSSLAKK